jgi:site-specific DNA-methyltransferase (adenine-specific)
LKTPIYLNKILCGDCYEIIKKLPTASIDCVIIDPPYLHRNGGGCMKGKNLERNIHKGSLDWLSNGFDYKVFKDLIRVCKVVNLFVFCSNKQISSIMGYFERRNYSVTLLTMHKTNAIPLQNGNLRKDTEYIVYIRGKGSTFNQLGYEQMSRVIKVSIVQGKKRVHETQKPESAIEYLLNIATNKGDLVLDCFLGSGTTAVAAKRLGRNFIGIEQSEKYCKIAQKRIDSEQLLVNSKQLKIKK